MLVNNSNNVYFSAITKEDGIDLEYIDALLQVVHDEEPKGVNVGVNIQVRDDFLCIQVHLSRLTTAAL